MARSRHKAGIIHVEGLTQLNRALKQMEPGLQAEFREANKEVATTVAQHAKSKAMSLGGVAAKTAPDITATYSVSRSAGVSFGGARAPWGAGAEFGGRGRPTTQQFQPWLGNGPGAGYFVYPTIRDDAELIEQHYTKAVDDLIRRAFPD